ncbi:MAG: hypothetical protein Q8M93_14525, partial [Polaromonas sp.]|uniref:hypothetical protein n=1 Tax=Polaromonas sp. TaxID=1869339 RepID=UPI0027331692
GKAQAAAKAVRLRKDCNAAMGAKARFHVSIFSGCSTRGLFTPIPLQGTPRGIRQSRPARGG